MRLISSRKRATANRLEADAERQSDRAVNFVHHAGNSSGALDGHVAVNAVDRGRPASHAKAVVDGLIRKSWSYQGIVMTDDLVMGAIYQHDVCTAVVEALNAGVDLLLVAYDGLQFYRLFACATDAAARGGLDTTMLHDSETRLRRALLVD